MTAIQFAGAAYNVVLPFVEIQLGNGWAGDALRPSIAFNQDDNSYLVVFQHRDSAAETWEIYGNRLDLNTDGSFMTNGTVDTSGREGAFRNRFYIGKSNINRADEPNQPLPEPDVAWGPAGNSFLTAWSYQTFSFYGIRARYAHDTHQAGDQTQGDEHQIIQPDGGIGDPAVAYSTSGNRYLVTCTTRDIANANITGRRMDAADSSAPAYQDPFAIAVSALAEEHSDVAYNPACGCYVVTYRHLEDNTTTLYAQQVRGAYSSAGQLDGGPLQVAQATSFNDTGSNIDNGRIACAPTAQQCLSTWQVDRFSFTGTNSDVNAQRLNCSQASDCTLEDDFSDPASGWATGEAAAYRVEYVAGEYQVWAKEPSGKILVNSPAQCKNCRIEVDARFEGTPFDRQGLVFGKEGDDYYAFLVNIATDECDLVRFWDGGSSLISQVGCNLKTFNTMAVEWQAPAIRTYIDGLQIHDVSDDSYSGERGTGVITYGQGDSRFDNYSVCSLLGGGGQFQVYLPSILKDY